MRDYLSIEAAKQVKVEAIEAELRRLWQEAEHDEELAVVRMCLHNLVVLTDAGNLAIVSDLVSDLTEVQPGRAIIIAVESNSAEDYIRAEISAQCRLPHPGRKQVCTEQIILRTGGRFIEGVDSVVNSIIISDLPVFLLWHTSLPIAPRVLDRLAESCDHIIFDSACFPNPPADFKQLNRFIQEADSATGRIRSVTDINWARMTPWRAALASLFDASEHRANLGRVKRAVIQISTSKADQPFFSNSRALLIAGWLSSTLGWANPREDGSRAKPGNVVTLTLDAYEETVDLVVEQVDAILDTDSECSIGNSNEEMAIIRLECGPPGHAVYSVSPRSGCLCSSAIIEGERVLKHSGSYSWKSDSELLLEEFDIVNRDLVYEQAVQKAVEIINSLGWM